MTRPPSSDADMPQTVALTGLPPADTRQARHTPAPPNRRPVEFPRVPGYEIVGELGRGGMGIVYRAKQLRLNRVVALKMLLRPDEADPADVLRFRSEAEAVASVEHPHVVHVHESGMFENGPFFAMEYLGGGTLHRRIREGDPLPPDAAAGLVGKLARAVHAAHAQGVVHRDLKPGNVLFDAAGEPRVTDFGLAKRFAQDLTRTQAIMGTPAYMAPEQAAGNARSAGPAADIYALGVILYECLAGEPPFAGGESMALLNRVIHDPAPPLRGKVPDAPRDLDLICRKCLEKRPADRYPTAAALADDLARFAAQEPVSVRPAGAVERAVKWARRRPTMAAAYALGVLAAVLFALGGGAAVLWRKAESGREAAAAARDEADAQRERAEANEEEARGEKTKVEEARAELEVKNGKLAGTRNELRKANAALEQALAKEKEALRSERDAKARLEEEKARAARTKYFRDVCAAQFELNDRNTARAVQLLNETPAELRGWEWHHVMRAAHPEVGTGKSRAAAVDVAFDPSADGNVVTGHVGNEANRVPGGGVTRFDFASKKGTPTQFAVDRMAYTVRLSADGRRALVVAYDKNAKDEAGERRPWVVSVWDVAGNEKRGEWRPPGTGWCRAEAISHDGGRVFVGIEGQPVRGYDAATGKELAGPPDRVWGEGDESVCHVRLAGTGRAMAAGFPDAVLVWDADGGRVTARLPNPNHQAVAVALDAAGTAVAAGSGSGELRVHYVGPPPARRQPFTLPRAHAGRIVVAAFHPTKPLLATAGQDGAVKLWNLETQAVEREFQAHAVRVFGLNFSPDGTRLVGVGEDRFFRIWPVVGTASPVLPWEIPPLPARPAGRAPRQVFLGPDGRRGFAAVDDDTALLWEADGKGGWVKHRMAIPDGCRIAAVAVHPGKAQVAFAGFNGRVWTWDAGAEPAPLFRFEDGRRPQLAYTPDGARLVAAQGKELRVWDVAARTAPKLPPLGNVVTHLAVSGDGTRIALGHIHYVGVYDADGKPLGETAGKGGELTALAFGPTAESVLVGRGAWQAQEFTLASREVPRREFRGHSAAVTVIAASPDGARVVTGSLDGRVKVWDYATGEEAVGLHTGQRNAVVRLTFVDGRSWVATPWGGPPVEFDGGPSHVLWLEGKADKPPAAK